MAERRWFNERVAQIATRVVEKVAEDDAMRYRMATVYGDYLTSASIGTTVQAYSANLASWAGIAPAGKQDASANLTSWSALAPSAKHDAMTQQSAIASPSGGATVDAEARAAVSSILTHLRTLGLIAT